MGEKPGVRRSPRPPLWRSGVVLVMVVVAMATSAAPAQGEPASGAAGPATSGPDAASMVDPFVGTGVNPGPSGDVGTFPGADVPFGMVQWSPDTTPDRQEGGGYHFGDTSISGFSLTHLSGAGCPIFGDVPILPVSGILPQDPADASQPFSHTDERASPGRYQVSLGTPAVTVRLSATTRTGIGQFTFPRTGGENLLIKVGDSANGIIGSSVRTLGTHEVAGSVTSGGFCGSATRYTLHFVAEFNQPFTSHGIWDDSGVEPGTAACSGSAAVACGAWVTFGSPTSRTITMKVGVSYVSVANAQLNLTAEVPGWSLRHVQQAATASWNAALGSIDVTGGSPLRERTFYTALYHALLDPSVFSDDNGQYEGLDGRLHNAGHRIQYANFSEWDIYRSQVQLLSMIEPARVSDMVQSLVNDADQTGWLPSWVIADGDAGTMNGDSADPIITDAYAFGVRDFDSAAAFKAMLKGATQAGIGSDRIEERQNLSEYEQRGFVHNDAVGQVSGVTIGGSETLEYAIDDFAVAQMAEDLGHQAEYSTMMGRAQNWQNLFNPATGYVQARLADGAFPGGPAFQPYPPALQAAGVNQEGFQEGNAVQYTWSVPQNLGGLFALMGGSAAATAELDTFFTQLNAGPYVPQGWVGNEPGLWAPWEYDYAGAPWRTQELVRQIVDELYPLRPAGEPGNDDLGAMSSWYVWAALGLYPVTPGTANLVLGSPVFPRSVIRLGPGRTLTVAATGTPATYVQAATVATGSGPPRTWVQAWLPAALLRAGGSVRFILGPKPRPAWGAGAESIPPSFAEGAAPAVGYTLPSGAVNAQPGQRVTATFGVRSDRRRLTTVSWSATPSAGVTVTPTSGQFTLPPNPAHGPPSSASTALRVNTDTENPGDVHIELTASPGSPAIPSVVLDVNPPG